MTDPLSMLDVIEESRQRAMEQRENAVQLLAAFALKAIIEGEDIREVAERCGFERPRPSSVAEANANVRANVHETSEMGLIRQAFFSYNYGGGERQTDPAEGFADWVCKALKDRILEALK
jgi:predicted xylose isomerase-like sugar epimerase